MLYPERQITPRLLLGSERIAVMIHAFTRLAIAALLLAAQTSTFAQPTPGQAPPAGSAKELPFVSSVFGDNMVLQRGKPDAMWGWSEAGDSVRVEIGDKSATAIAGPDRRWQVKIEPP